MWRALGVLLVGGLLAGACGDDGDAGSGNDAVAVAQRLAERLDQEAIEVDEVFVPLLETMDDPPGVAWFIELCSGLDPIRQATYEEFASLDAPDGLSSWDAYIEAKRVRVETGQATCQGLQDDPAEAEAAVADGVPIFSFIEPVTRPVEDAEFAACLDLQAEVGAITDLVLNCDGIPPGQ